MVSVHTGYVAGDFPCLLDSDVSIPREWADDLPRRRAAHIPDDGTFRTKPEMALDQIGRCLGNGIRVAAWTFDELYGRDGGFLDIEPRLRTVVGYRHLPRLRAALQSSSNRSGNAVA